MQAEVKELLALRTDIAEMDASYEEAVSPLKLKRDALQAKITEELKGAGAELPGLQRVEAGREVSSDAIGQCKEPGRLNHWD